MVCVILTKIAILGGLMVKDFAYILRIKNTTSLAQTVQKCMVLAKHLNTILVILNNHATSSLTQPVWIRNVYLMQFYFIKSSKDLIYTFLNKSSVFLYNN